MKSAVYPLVKSPRIASLCMSSSHVAALRSITPASRLHASAQGSRDEAPARTNSCLTFDCRLFLLCSGHVSNARILPKTCGSVLETIRIASIPAKPEEFLLPPLHSATRLGQLQTHKGPTAGCKPLQQICHRRGLQQGSGPHKPSVP